MNHADMVRLIASETRSADEAELARQPRIEYGSDTWRNVEMWLHDQIATRTNEALDPMAGMETTYFVRGQIDAFKAVLNLAAQQKLLDSGEKDFIVEAQ